MECNSREPDRTQAHPPSTSTAATMILGIVAVLTTSVAQAEPPSGLPAPAVSERSSATAMEPASPQATMATSEVSPSAPAVDSHLRFTAAVAEARRLYREVRYEEALRAFQTAQTLEQLPWLHLELARTYRRLGQTEDALASYRQFLALDPNPIVELRNEADQAIRQLTGLPAMVIPAPQRATSEADLLAAQGRFTPHPGMRGAGWLLLSAGYATSALVGILAGLHWAAETQTERPASITGYSMVIPVAGSLVSATMAVFATTSRGAVSNGSGIDPTTYYTLSWSLPVLLLGAGTQITGLALLYASYSPKYRLPRPLLGDLRTPQITPYATSGGAGLSLSGIIP